MAFIRGAIKNSPWIVIAVVLHVIAITVLSIVAVNRAKKADEQRVAIGIAKAKEEPKKDEDTAIPEQVDRTAMPKPPTDKDYVLVPPEDFSGVIEAPTVDTPDAGKDNSPEMGSPDLAGGGTSIGVGGGGHFGGQRASTFASRSAHPNGGGTGSKGGKSGPQYPTDAAVLAGQTWLARHQQKDGSWAADKMKDLFDANEPKCGCGEAGKDGELTGRYNEGLTGLAVLAFLGSGLDSKVRAVIEDPVRPGRRYAVGKDVVLKALKWLKQRQDAHPDGRFSDGGDIMYNEALATLAMVEAFGMTGVKQFGDSAQRGIDFLVKAQRLDPSGTKLWGWRYEPKDWFESDDAKKDIPDPKERVAKSHEADVSVTTWVVMALKSAELCGLKVPHESMEGAMNFVNFVTTKDRGVAYMDPKWAGRKITSGERDEYMFHPTTLDALGMCIRTFAEKNIDDPVLDQSANRIVADLPRVSEGKDKKDALAVDYYYWYYATLALSQFDGPDSPRKAGSKVWKAWEKSLFEGVLIPLQDKSRTCCQGGWTTPDRWSYAGGPIYRTAINVLTLEAYYRYDNIFLAAANAAKKAGEDKGRERDRENGKKPEGDKKPEEKPK